MNGEQLVQLALENGAVKAVVISGDKIELSSSFREICQENGCGNYGKCWMCPPFIGEIEELMEKVRGYSFGLLYQTISTIEDSFDIEGMEEAARAHAAVSQRVEEAVSALLPKKHLHLSCGSCNLCEECAKRKDEPCRYPQKALSSLEGYGVDVYRTVQDTDLKYINGENTVTFFGMVLY